MKDLPYNEEGSVDKVRISLAPIVLVFFAERSKGTLSEITRFVYSVKTNLENTPIVINAIFRGNFNSPNGEIWSETVNDELWYWLSNDFIEECSSSENICFEVKKSLDEFKLDKMEENLKKIRWPSEENKNQLICQIREVLNAT